MPTTLEEALKVIETLQGEKTTLETRVADLEKATTDKDTRISELEKVTKDQAQNFKKLRDMTEQEKEQYTEKELDLMRRTEALAEEQEALKKSQQDFTTKQRETAIQNTINKYARGDKDLAAKIRANFDGLKDADAAMDEAVIAPLVEKSVNMLGSEAPDPLRAAHNLGGGPGDIPAGSFADSAEGKAVMAQLGLPTEGGQQ